MMRSCLRCSRLSPSSGIICSGPPTTYRRLLCPSLNVSPTLRRQQSVIQGL